MWKKTLVGIILGGATLGAPLVPVEMEWVVSYETVAFDTPDKDLAVNEYATTKDGWYIRNIPKSIGGHVYTTNPDDILGKKEVQIQAQKSSSNPDCLGCAYYDEFRHMSGKIKRINSEQTSYKRLQEVKDAPHPSDKEFVSIITPLITDAAIALDAVSEGTEASASSISWSHTVVSATNGAVVVFAVNTDNPAPIWSTTASTFNGTAMDRESFVQVDAGANDIVGALYTIKTAGEGTGSKTVVITSDTTVNMYGAAHTYTGVDQADVSDGAQSDGNDNTGTVTVTVTTGSSGDLVVGYAAMEDNLTGVGADQTERTDTEVDGIFTDFRLISSDEPGGASIVHSYTNTGVKAWIIHAINLNQSVATPATSIEKQSVIWFD
jgi:hypothetical protein